MPRCDPKHYQWDQGDQGDITRAHTEPLFKHPNILKLVDLYQLQVNTYAVISDGPIAILVKRKIYHKITITTT